MSSIKYSVNSLSQTIEEEGSVNKFPVIVHNLKFDKESKSRLTKIFTDPQLVDMINVQFQSFGLDPAEY